MTIAHNGRKEFFSQKKIVRKSKIVYHNDKFIIVRTPASVGYQVWEGDKLHHFAFSYGEAMSVIEEISQ